MEELLISLVRERPIFFDKTHPGYKDVRGRRHNNWIDVAAVMAEKGYSEGTTTTFNKRMIKIIVMLRSSTTTPQSRTNTVILSHKHVITKNNFVQSKIYFVW